MSFKSSCFQSNLNNTYYKNTIVEIDTGEADSIASINYVNEEVLNINNDITNLNNTILLLQNQINTINTSITTLENSIVRITGTIFIGLTSTAPNYALYCDGSTYLISDYQNLYNVIGIAYGGDGITTFNVPNFKNYFLLGGNGSLNNVSASNLMTGNNTSGANNNFLISGNSYHSGTTFPILQYVPSHSHTIIDNGHQHSVGDFPNYGGFSPSTTPFIDSTQTINSFTTSLNPTGISIENRGPQIQQIDPISNINGLNICPPFISCNFFINI
jgi:microcystin-dependent protein